MALPELKSKLVIIGTIEIYKLFLFFLVTFILLRYKNKDKKLFPFDKLVP